MGLRRVRFARGSSAKNLIGSLIGAIDEDSRCGFLFSTLLEGKTFSHTFPINCSTKQRCQLYSTNVPEKTREQLNFPAKFWTNQKHSPYSLFCFYPLQTRSRSRKHTQTSTDPQLLYLLQEGCLEYAWKICARKTAYLAYIATGHPNCVKKQQ